MTGWDLAASLDDILTDDFTGGPFETVYVHRAGFCARQVYLTTLGLRGDTDWQGRFQTCRALQQHLQDELKRVRPDFDVAPRVEYESEGVTFVGRPTCWDADHRTVYHLKPRNGWYRFNPSIQRHIDQLRIDM